MPISLHPTLKFCIAKPWRFALPPGLCCVRGRTCSSDAAVAINKNLVRLPAELPSVLPLPVPPNLVEIVCPAGVFPVEAVLEGHLLVNVTFHVLQPPLGYLFAAVRSASPLVQRLASPQIRVNHQKCRLGEWRNHRRDGTLFPLRRLPGHHLSGLGFPRLYGNCTSHRECTSHRKEDMPQ